MTYIEGADFFVRIVSLPIGIFGAIAPNEDGTYNLYLSDSLDDEHRLDAYIHEYLHLVRDDLHNSRSIYVIEDKNAL